MSSMKRPNPFNALFLCTGNSARSVMAECILNRLGAGKFRAYSAGSHPAGKVNPIALNLLRKTNYDVSGLRSKSWDEFTDGVAFERVVTVCSNAARETCPVIPGRPAKTHWDIPDPSAVKGTQAEIAVAFLRIYGMLTERIEALVREP